MSSQDELAVLHDVLTKFDSAAASFADHEISSAIKEIKRSDSYPPPTELAAEQMAFEFCEDYQDQSEGWGTYYGPMLVWPEGDGTVREYPSISLLNPEIISYWTTRALEATHPILRARYADLVWVFAKIVTSITPSVQMAHITIDSRLEISKRDYHEYEIATIDHLKRAITLSTSLNDTDRIKRTRQAIVAYEDRISEDEKLGTWGFCYDLLISVKHRKYPLPESLEKKIITDLEDRFERLTKGLAGSLRDIGIFGAEKAARYLSSHYRRQNHSAAVRRVLACYFDAFKHLVDTDEPGLASAWLLRTHELFVRHGLEEEAKQISIELRKIGSGVISELKSTSVETEIAKEDLENYVRSIIDVELTDALVNVTHHFIPKWELAEKEVLKLAREYPLSFLITREILDYEGRPVTSIGPIKDDLEGNVVSYVSQLMTFSTFFLRQVMTSLIEKFELSSKKMADHLFLSPVFCEDRRGIIEHGLKAYFENDYVTSIHTLVPQIEAGVRKLVELSGGSILRRNRNGAMQYRALDELLRDDIAESVLKTDMIRYFQTTLTDQRGWNLRNIVCHGMMPQTDFGYGYADRVVHSLLCLALARS